MNSGDSSVSLTQLEVVSKSAEALRASLCGAFLNDAPMIEVSIFKGLMRLLEILLPSTSLLSPLLPLSSCSSLVSSFSFSTFVAEYYLQEIFAALLFFADESAVLPSGVSVVTPPRRQITTVPESEFYVDHHTRRYCAELLIFLCFSQTCRPYRVVQALYPLLLKGDTAFVSGVSQNHIAEGLFNSSRFLQRRRFLSNLLSGVLMSLFGGVVAVLRVLLLADGVDDSMTADAAEKIASLFATPLRRAWILKENVVTYTENIKLEDQVCVLSAQLIHLMGTLSDCVLTEVEQNKAADRQVSAFLQKLREKTEQKFLKPETFEERLHFGIVTILNKILCLVPREENKALYEQSYRFFCLYNRHFLTPAFRVLSLRSLLAGGGDEVLLALRRLVVLARGSTLGPSPRALLVTLEPVSPGLLELFASLDNLPFQHLLLIRALLEALWKMEAQFEEVAHIFVRAVFMPVRCSYAVDRVAAKILVNTENASPAPRRLRGLRSLVFQETTPNDVKSAVLTAAAAMCQQHSAVATAVSVEEKGSLSKCVDFLYKTTEQVVEDAGDGGDVELMLVRMVEEMCLRLGADEAFGTRATLDLVCSVLASVVPISHSCWRWVVLLIPSVLSVDVINITLAQYVTASERQKAARALTCQMQRISRLLTALRDVAVDVAAEKALDAAIAATQQYEVGHVVCTDTINECFNAMRAVEESLDARLSALLIVNLLVLARVAEETAYNFCRNFALLHEKGIADEELRYGSDRSAIFAIVSSAFYLLARVLAEVDDVYAAVTACKTIVWWSIARCDSADSSFVGRLVVDLLCLEETNPASLCRIIPSAKAKLTSSQIGRMKVRVLDVLLGLCDYDTEGRTLRNIDDYCMRERRCGLFDVLADLCGPQHCDVVQVTAPHIIGHYAIATFPRVSLTVLCTLCVDVFRHTPYEMAKAACASMMANVASFVATSCAGGSFVAEDIKRLREVAEAMRVYRGTGNGGDHVAVICGHGEFVVGVLRESQLSFCVQET